MQWQPIKSAPTGARVLVSDQRGNVFIARSATLRWYDDSERLIDRPRWWMPLPESPHEEMAAVAPARKPAASNAVSRRTLTRSAKAPRRSK